MSVRFGSLTREKPKCLLQTSSETILHRIIRICARLRLRNLTIVTGHGEKYVKAAIENILNESWADGMKIMPLYNPEYAKINNCYSLLLGLPERDESVLVINSDDVFDSRILAGISRVRTSKLVIDNVKKLTKESMKVYLKGSYISRIGKWLDIDASAGEYIGLAKIVRRDIPALRKALLQVVTHNPNGFYEHAFDIMFDKTRISPYFTNGLKWTEVDTREDLAVARKLVKKGLK